MLDPDEIFYQWQEVKERTEKFFGDVMDILNTDTPGAEIFLRRVEELFSFVVDSAFANS